jgi:ribosomal protein S27AE
MVKIVVLGTGNVVPMAVTLRCPHCGREVVMESVNVSDISVGNGIVTGQRKCPNRGCNGHVFVALRQGAAFATFPPVRLDFDPQGIPQPVLKAFEEAITCHSQQCFTASAIMVRRTLEEVCKDRNATGKDLRLRIQDLRSKIVIPTELLDAMDELRILGNDAAHIETKEFLDISDGESVAAIQFTKEILKALYQYSALLDRLRNLKKKP